MLAAREATATIPFKFRWTLLGDVGRCVHDVLVAANELQNEERQMFVVKHLAKIELELNS